MHEELLWDRRALDAADLLSDDRVAGAGATGTAAGCYPSLHLNLGECYRKLGDTEQAREHLERGLAAVSALGDDGYGRMIESGPHRLAERIAHL